MDKIYTDFNLLRYYYCETDLFDTLEIEHAFEEDIDFKFEYQILKQSLDLLAVPKMSPSQNTINNILSYSKAKI
jgi:hypothetical protein